MSSNTPDDPSSSAESSTNVRREVWKLGLIFGTMYFVQGINEPAEGLMTQPASHLLKTWKNSNQEITRFAAWLSIPWALKPLFGLLTDFVPLAGYRRKSYLFLTSLVTVVGFLIASMADFQSGDETLLLLCLLVPTIAVAFNDVVTDALMIERSQPLGATGKIQSIQWAMIYGALILTGTLGGWLSGHNRHAWAFMICALSTLPILLISLSVREPPTPKSSLGFFEGLKELRQGVFSRKILGIAAFLFLWSFNPFSKQVLYLYATESLRLGEDKDTWGGVEQFWGNTLSLQAVTAILACAVYGLYCRRVSMRLLVHLSIVLGILSTLAYWFMVNEPLALIITGAVGFTYMTAMLIQLDLAAQICPPLVAGTLFALLMGLSNLATSLSTWLGGDWYELGIERWGETTSFNFLVLIGALFTAACWLIVPRTDPRPPS